MGFFVFELEKPDNRAFKLSEALYGSDSLTHICLRFLEELVLFVCKAHVDDLVNAVCTDECRNVECYAGDAVFTVKSCGYCSDRVLVFCDGSEERCSTYGDTVECSALELDDLCAGRLCLLCDLILNVLTERYADCFCVLIDTHTCYVSVAPCRELCLAVLAKDITVNVSYVNAELSGDEDSETCRVKVRTGTDDLI